MAPAPMSVMNEIMSAWAEAFTSFGRRMKLMMSRSTASGAVPTIAYAMSAMMRMRLRPTLSAIAPAKGGRMRPAVLKLHGCLDRQSAGDDSYVITEDSYIDYLSGGDVGALIPIALSQRMTSNSLLFLGYSLSDAIQGIGITLSASAADQTLLKMSISQIAPILPYLFLVLILIFRPKGLLGTREG